MHDVEHAGQGVERGFQGCLVVDIVGQHSECRADQEIGLPQQLVTTWSRPSDRTMPWARAISRPNVTACA